MLTYKDLPANEKEQLLRFPVYISLLAANYHNNGIDRKEKENAVEYAHIKTFSCNPLLKDFFADAESKFEEAITELNEQLPKKKQDRELVIKQELSKLEKIAAKLGPEYSVAMQESMRDYKEHVAHAHQSLLEYLIFPIPIKGLTY